MRWLSVSTWCRIWCSPEPPSVRHTISDSFTCIFLGLLSTMGRTVGKPWMMSISTHRWSTRIEKVVIWLLQLWTTVYVNSWVVLFTVLKGCGYSAILVLVKIKTWIFCLCCLPWWRRNFRGFLQSMYFLSGGTVFFLWIVCFDGVWWNLAKSW